MKKVDIRLVVISILFVLSATVIIAISQFTSEQANLFTTSSKAAETVPECKCTDSDVCYPDGCSRKPKTSNNTFDEARYDAVCKQFDPGYRMPDRLIQFYCSQHQPDCCFDIYRYKDDRLCCFQERWTCHPSLCEGASGNGDCGKYWGLPGGWDAYGCVKKDSNGNKVPYWGLPPGLPGASQPTSTPVPPTSTPRPTTPPPTATPRPSTTAPTATTKPSQITPTPTRRPGTTNQPTVPPGQPTNTIPPADPNATWTPVPTWTPAPTWTGIPANPDDPQPTEKSPFSLPFFGRKEPVNPGEPQQSSEPLEIKSPKELAREVVNPENVRKLDQATEKPLTKVKEGFDTVKKYDRQLESYFEGWIFRIRVWMSQVLR